MEQESFSEKQSLELISRMIQSAKTTFSDDGIYYTLWGWAVLIAALTQFFLMQVNSPYSWISWPILMPSTAVASMIIGYRKSRKRRVKTFVEEFIHYLWGAFGASLVIVIVFMDHIGPENAYPVIIILYGIGTFVSGGALRFTPLKVGGIICWIMAIAAFYSPFQYQLLIIAATVVLAYIIPGVMLQRKYRTDVKSTMVSQSEPV